ncbi:MAG: acetate kinase, partial [Anaerolineae bacterium]
MKILVLNCGSSSVKYEVFAIDGKAETVLASGIVEEVGLGNASLTHKRPGRDKVVRADLPVQDHRNAIEMVLGILVSDDYGVLAAAGALDAVGHRVVHGGERFAASVRITGEVLQALRDNIPLAPLHNPPNIQG